jgi:hypothetical protein
MGSDTHMAAAPGVSNSHAAGPVIAFIHRRTHRDRPRGTDLSGIHVAPRRQRCAIPMVDPVADTWSRKIRQPNLTTPNVPDRYRMEPCTCDSYC